MDLNKLTLDQLDELTLEDLYNLPIDSDDYEDVHVINADAVDNRVGRATVYVGPGTFSYKSYGDEVLDPEATRSVRVNEDYTKEEILIGE